MTRSEIFEHQCKLYDGYFFNACVIDTCKNNSPALSSRCMMQERRSSANSDKGLSDHEIMYYKGYKDIREVGKAKRKATESVHTIIILNEYLEYCESLPLRVFDSSIVKSKRVVKLLDSYPLNYEGFSISTSALAYAVSRQTYAAYLEHKDCKTCGDYQLTDLLKQTQSNLSKLVDLFNLMELK